MLKRNILISLILPLSVIIGLTVAYPVMAKTCGGADTSVIECSGTGAGAIFDILKIVIQILTAGIGIAAVGATIYGAILYTSSADSPEKIKKAKEIWINTVIGLIFFAFMVALTNFLIPGGVFG